MIFEADEDLNRAALNTKVYYDWAKDPEAWSIVQEKVFSDEKERNEHRENYLDYILGQGLPSSEETSKILEYHTINDEPNLNDPKYVDREMMWTFPGQIMLATKDAFEALEEGIKEKAQQHQPIILKDEYYRVPEDQHELAGELGLLHNENSNEWYWPPHADKDGWVVPKDHFEKIPKPAPSIEHKAPYTELNEQIDAIRKNPLLILEASEQVRNAAVNARVCVDWFNDPEAWKVIKDHQTAKDAKEIQSLVAYNRHTNEDYRDFNIDDATGNREGFEIWDDASVVAKTVIHENPAAVFEFKTAEDLDYGKIHFEMEAENENFNFGFEPSPDLERKELKDQYYSIPESHQERAEKAGFVQEKEPNEWRLPPYVNRLSEEVEQVKNVSARIEPVWVNRVEYIRKNVFAEKSTGNIAEGSGETMKALDKLRDRECDPKTFKAGAKFFSAQVKMLKEMDKSGMSGEAKKGITLRQEQLRSSQKMYNVLGRSSPEVARTVKSRVLLAANTLGMDF